MLLDSKISYLRSLPYRKPFNRKTNQIRKSINFSEYSLITIPRVYLIEQRLIIKASVFSLWSLLKFIQIVTILCDNSSKKKI